MDLNRLKIDRSQTRASSMGARRTRGGPWFGRLVLLAVLAAAAWLFWTPLSGFIDSLRLPVVATARVVKPDPAAAGAVTGTASNGYIVARVRAALSADTPGRIIELNVEEGQTVKHGFVVARLFADEYEAALRRAEAELSVARATVERSRAEVAAVEADLSRLRSSREAAAASLDEARSDRHLAGINLARVRELVESDMESARLLDEAEAAIEATGARVVALEAQLQAAVASEAQGKSRIDVARAAVTEALAAVDARSAARDLARATLDKTIIRAPFDGIVVLKDAEVGEVVSPNSQAGSNARGSVATMVDFASLEVQAEVPETSLAAVRIGAPARIFLDAYPDRPYRGRVERIWPTANRQQATIEVRISFAERDDRLRPEMGVRVVFVSDESAPADEAAGGESDELLLIPSDAVIRRDGKDGVFVLERDVARYRTIRLGPRRSNRVAVESGLFEDEIVVRSPPPSLADGDRVRVGPGP